VDGRKKVESLVDNCRISWGQVKRVGSKELDVTCRPVLVEDGKFCLSKPVVSRVCYDPEVRSFSKVKAGDWVTMHWGYACEVITQRQLRNIAKYTELDIIAANSIPKASRWRQ
jgi:hypothetical protein